MNERDYAKIYRAAAFDEMRRRENIACAWGLAIGAAVMLIVVLWIEAI